MTERGRRARLFVVSLAAGGVIAAALYVVGPLVTSGDLVTLQARIKQAEDRQREAHSDLRESPADSRDASEQRVLEAQSDVTRLRDRFNSLSLPTSYWLKLIKRPSDRTERAGVLILHAIVWIGSAALVYWGLLWRTRSFPGARWEEPDEQLVDERIEFIRRCYTQTGSVDSMRQENESRSAQDESTVAYYLMPMRWCEWLLPIVGFIGTVVGISGSVDRLQFGIAELFVEGLLSEKVLAFFNQGFAALSVAFDTTFFGLVGLAIVGSVDLLLRRQGLGAIQKVDAKGQAEIERLVDQATYVDPWDEFRKWVQEELPKLMTDLSDQEVEALREALAEEAGRLRGTIAEEAREERSVAAGYGQLLARLNRSQAYDLRTLSRLQQFVLACTYAAGRESPEAFWRRFVQALEEPMLNAPEMTLLVSPGEQTMDALAVAAAPYLVAVAERDSDGENLIRIFSLEPDEGERWVFSPQGSNDALAPVHALAFAPNGRLLAYALADGTLGVLDLHSDTEERRILPGPVTSAQGIAWWSSSREGILALVAGEDEATALCFAPVDSAARGVVEETATSRLRGDVQVAELDEFRGDSLALQPGVGRALVAGREGDTAQLRRIGIDAGELTVRDALSIEESSEGIASVCPTGAGGRTLLVATRGGRLVILSGWGEEPPSEVRLSKPQPLLVAPDDAQRFIAVATQDSTALDLLEFGSHELVRTVPGHGEIRRAATSPDGRLVVVAGEDGHVAYWEFPVYLVS